MLKNHYLEKDLSLVETELGKLLVAFEKSKTMVENAQFEDNQKLFLKSQEHLQTCTC